MHRNHIKDLEIANGQNYFGLTDATGVQEYRQLDPGDFTVSGDVNNNGMSFADVVAGNAPAVTPTPPGFAGVIANNGTLIRKYNNLIRVWVRTAGVWAHSFDTPRNKYIFNQTIYTGSTALAPAAIPLENFVVPTDLNGWTIETVYLKVYNGIPGDVISYDIIQNGAIVASSAFGANPPGFSILPLGLTAATLDLLGATATGCGTCTTSGLFITWVLSPPNYVT